MKLVSGRKILALFVVVTAVSACAPRGEQHSVDQVLTTNRDLYLSMSSAAVPADVHEALNQLTASLDELAGLKGQAAVASDATKGVADTLSNLVDKAGYTQRAAMGELISQYRALSSNATLESGAPQLKLIAARTYRLLGSELTSTKFGL